MSHTLSSEQPCSNCTSPEGKMMITELVEELEAARVSYETLLQQYEKLSAEYNDAIDELEQHKVSVSKLEFRLESENKKAQSAEKVQKEFLDTLSHELLTPLNGILGMARLLNDIPLTQEAKDSIEVIKACGESLEGKLKNLFDYVQLSRGEIEFIPSIFEPAACIQSLVSEYAPAIYQKGLEIAYIPLHNDYLSIKADKDRVEQLIHIFLSNAVKFTQGGHILIKSSISEQPNNSLEPHELQLSFIDTGIGIAAKDKKKIFRPFEQLDSSNNRIYEGFGIGLALAKEIVSQMKGAILVDSILGEGSTFSVSIPLNMIKQSAAPPIPSIELNKGITFSTLHPPHEELLTKYLSELKIDFTFDKNDSIPPPTNGLWIIDYPSSEELSEQLKTRIKKFSHQFENIIALVPPGKNIPSSIKHLIEIIIPKPISLPSLKDALLFASSLDRAEPGNPDATEQSGVSRHPAVQKVLLVENNRVNQKIIVHQLGMLDVPVEIIESLDELKTKLSTSTYSHVVINPNVDPTSNLSLIYLILNAAGIMDTSHLVAITGRNDRFTEQQLEEAGFKARITLPAQLDEFAEALQVNHN